METQDIPLDLLKDNPYDKRKRVGDIEGLAKSIEKRGLQNPISVIKNEDGTYYIVHGHRRTHAFRYLKRDTIPAFVRKETTSADLMIDLAVENFQRKDLSPAEMGATLEQLFYSIPSVENKINSVLALLNQIKMYEMRDKPGAGFSEDDILNAKDLLDIVGISVNTAITYVRLLLLPEEIQENIVKASNAAVVPEGKIVTKSAYELTRITDPEKQKELAEKIMKDKMTHIQIKNIVDKIIEDDSKVARKGITSSAKRRTEDDVGAAKLTDDLSILSSKIDSFRLKLPLVKGRLNETDWIISMEKMKKTCTDMVKNINNIFIENMKIEDMLEYVNSDLEVTVNRNLRFKLPVNIIDTLKIEEGDILLLKIESIKKLPKSLIEQENQARKDE